MTNETDFVTIFETRLQHEALMVLNAFDELGIPAFGRQRSITGETHPLHEVPWPQKDDCFIVGVAQNAVADAEKVLQGLPLPQPPNRSEPDLVIPNSASLFWQWFGAVLLVLILAGYFSGLWREFWPG